MNVWSELVLDSVIRPRSAARRLLALDLEARVLLETALASTCLGMVLGFLAFSISPGAVDMVTAAVLANPVLGAAVQLTVMLLMVFLVFRVGQAFGGAGHLWGAVAIVVWINCMMVLMQAVQLVAMLLFAPLAALLAVASFIWSIWALAGFVGELHGFRSTISVLGGILVTLTVMFFGLMLLLSGFGLMPQGSG